MPCVEAPQHVCRSGLHHVGRRLLLFNKPGTVVAFGFPVSGLGIYLAMVPRPGLTEMVLLRYLLQVRLDGRSVAANGGASGTNMKRYD